MTKTCIVCKEKATMTTIREEIEAAFCDDHYPTPQFVVHVKISQ